MSAALSRSALIRGAFARRSAPTHPPWAVAEPHFAQQCTGCGDCRSACPHGLVRIGADGHPEMDFQHGECDFCGACVQACKHGALSATARAHGVTPWTVAARVDAGCLAYRGVMCRICGDVCPESAIGFRPRADGRDWVSVDTTACTGCGACVAPCPAGAIEIGERSGG